MKSTQDPEYLASLVHELRKLPRETEWLEFKVNYSEPEKIGQYISALANSAAMVGKASAYMIWGISDGDHKVVGTTFKPSRGKIGHEELENWLIRKLTPTIDFQFSEALVDGCPVVVLEIGRAFRQPVQFGGEEYIRIGSYKKKLKDFPEKERLLWRTFDETPFEDRVAVERVRDEDVLRLLDYPSYFELLALPLPENRVGILRSLEMDNLIRPCDAGGWDVTNLGAVLFARQLERVHNLRRKAVRIVQYAGDGRTETVREEVDERGYAPNFEEVIRIINGMLPSNEVIETALRTTKRPFPELAVRELVANALIHQDFFVTGAGPLVEIFENRIEITNPGAPLVETHRFVDSPPRSRNESLASLMRRIGICEERGSGWDKVVFQSELHELPAPLAEVVGDNTRVVLFAPRPLAEMDKKTRVRAIYLHACLRYVGQEYVTNSSVRQRFRIEARNSAKASRLIKEAMEEGLIVLDDPRAALKLRRYVPWWAKEGVSGI